MSSRKPVPTGRADEASPVDDVRRVRERLSAEADGDVRRLAERAQRVAEQQQAALGLKPVAPPAITR